MPSVINAVVLSLLSGLLLSVPFHDGRLWIIAWAAFVPLLAALDGVNKPRAFLFSFIAGCAFWLSTIYWLVHVTAIGTVLLSLYLALYFGIFGLIISSADFGLRTRGMLFPPSVWVVLEYARSHLLTGFPWAILGNSQYLNLPAIQIADICGALGVSWVIVFVNACLWQAISRRSKRAAAQGRALASPIWPGASTIRPVAVTLCALVAVLAYGYYRLLPRAGGTLREPLRTGLVQGNIPQEDKWDSSKRGLIFEKYARMTAEAAGDGLDLIVWPEASLPTVPEEDPAYFLEAKSLARTLNSKLLIGAVTRRGQSYYNSAILISAEAQELQRYDKVHLVPFGEYIPLKKSLPFLEAVVPIGDMTSGATYTVFRIPGHGLHLPERDTGSATLRHYPLPVGCGVLICFEDVFPELSRQFVRRGAEFLINITNDAWYKMTTAAYQHLSSSVLRAVEVRRPLIRAANTGVTCVVEPSGRITQAVKDAHGRSLFIDGVLIAAITPARGLSFYARFGELPIFCIVGIALLWYSLHGLMRGRTHPHEIER